MGEARMIVNSGNELERAKTCYVFLQHCLDSQDPDLIINIPYSIVGFISSEFSVITNFFLNHFFVPFYNFIVERLRFSNLILSLVQRFKFRTEWFTRKELYEKFANEGYKEGILNKSLQLYLHDQGIDFPLSGPESPSGEADLVTKLELPDSPIIEVKVFDPKRGYTLKRLQKGFKQLILYTRDYNKKIGCLVIFNPSEYNLILRLHGDFVLYAGKMIAIEVVDIYPSRESASKRLKFWTKTS